VRLRHLFLLGLLALPSAASAQDQMSRAFDLERRGSFAQAAELYRGLLRTKPGDVAALLGLERSLTPLNRVAEMLPAINSALASNPTAGAVYAAALRVYGSANMTDSIPALVERWARVAPGDETPYREWATAALQRRDRLAARKAYLTGREKTGKPDALAPEIAQLAVADADWPTAVREWSKAVRQLPGYRSSATSTLSAAPETARPEILKAFEKETGPEAARIAVDLRARWGDPLGAFDALIKALPGPVPQQLDALQAFLEIVRLDPSQPYQLAQGKTLEALAERWTAAPQKARFRLDAARAYVTAGQKDAARRMLTQIANDANTAPAVAGGATATLIELLLAENAVAEASTQLERYRATLPVEDYLRLRRGVAARWAQGGDIAKAEQLLEPDSSIDAIALRGRFRLYAGDIKGTSDMWKAAGPYAGSREAATERAAILALLQPIGSDSVPQLGAAFRQLDGGDSSGAAGAFARAAESVPAEAGRPEVQLYAGRIYAALNKAPEAEKLMRSAVVKESPATAAAALLELGRLQLKTNRRDEAKLTLEQMILEYPTSPLVPQGRRLLDQARNAVPQT
jgi:tetratricopeptide (TPR) repeat protein